MNHNSLRILLLIISLLAVSVAPFLIHDQHKNTGSTIDSLLKLKDIHRSIDGSHNNEKHPNWGKSNTNFIRMTEARYEDGKGKPIENLPNPRFLSEAVGKLEDNIVIPNEFNLTMLFGTWGQFLDHDITLTLQSENEVIQIVVPRCDQFFDKNCTGKETIPYFRSEYDHSLPVRTMINGNTLFIDASMVYGSDLQKNKKLRTFKNGKLKTSAGNMLPFDESGFWFAGDIRADENMGLTTLQVLFLREHNRLCDEIIKFNSSLSDEEVFNMARNYVIGLIQKISMYEYLPNLFGPLNFKIMIGDYKGYDSSVDPSLMNEFSSTAYRIGHPYIPHTYKAVDNNNATVQKINLYDLLVCTNETFTPHRFNTILKGLAFTLAKVRDLDYVDELRNVPKKFIGMNVDLFATNVDRNRDNGMPDYNTLREAFGLEKRKTFEQIFPDQDDRAIVAKSFNSVNNIDTYIGVLGEFKLPGSMFGDLGATIAAKQFNAIRNGDRFWFEHAYPKDVVEEIKATTLTEIIQRNTDIKDMPRDGFFCHNCSVN